MPMPIGIAVDSPEPQGIQTVINHYLFFATFFLAGVAHAENGCPPGQLPAQANGAITSCTPIPSGYYQREAPPPRPSGKWVKTWGAIAMGYTDSATTFGVTKGKLSEAEAQTDALMRCGSRGLKNCKIVLKYHNQCAAVAEPHIDGSPYSDGRLSFAGSATIPEASSRALSDCKKNNRSTPKAVCEIIYTACTEQIFEKF
ncbi:MULTISPECIES: DUF4189 domain-containing protein [Gammaproteobacteria]|uniref:DUF4189 domain-containing protein n=1 Tax=uncultured Xanthomonas sp. TaxID=152831 RepID=UPI00258A033D|nr:MULTISPECIES: DUF4189 domain-containing protein [Gammaproteobacteria]